MYYFTISSRVIVSCHSRSFRVICWLLQQVDIHTKVVICGDIRDSSLIAFCLKPKVNEYYKIVLLVGDEALDGCVLPDVNLLVKTGDFFNGNFKRLKLNKESRLTSHSSRVRDSRSVQIFTLERCSFSQSNVNENELARARSIAVIGKRPLRLDWRKKRKACP